MNLYQLAASVIEALDAEGIPYMVVGYITRWCELHQTSGRLQVMLAEIGPLL